MTNYQRTFQIHTRAGQKTDGELDMAISSEEPVERFFGMEILSHAREAVLLDRLNDGRHPLLLNHDTDKQIGVLERAWVDTDRKLRGQARFSRSALGQEIQTDVADGIRRLVSVGYEILSVEERTKNAAGELVTRNIAGEEFRREMQAKYGEAFYRAGPAANRATGAEPPTYVVTRWRPFEASIVAVAADTTVGVGRSTQHRPGDNQGPGATRRPTLHLSSRGKIMSDHNQQTGAQKVVELGRQYSKYVTDKDVQDAILIGLSFDDFREVILEKMESRHTDTREVYIGMEKREAQRYSIARAVAAVLTGDWTQAGLERAASLAVARVIGKPPEGFYVPFDVFRRDFNVGTGSEAGNLVATELRNDLFVDVLRNNLVMAGLGVRILTGLTGNIDIPKKSTASAITRVTEIQALTETNPTTGKLSLTPKRFGGFVEYSKQALIQSSVALEPMLRDDLLTSGMVDLQDQMLNGSGAGANMRGIRNTSGVGSVVGGTNGIAPAWSHVVDLESACANVNAEPDRFSGYLINSKTRGKLKQTQKATNLPFIWDNGPTPLNGYRAAVSNSVPSNLTKGTSTTIASSLLFASDWSMAVLAMFGAPDITVDPYTLATTGQVRITLNQYADFGVRLPTCFSVMDDALSG